MEQTQTAAEALLRLEEPFAPKDVKWLVAATTKDGRKGRSTPYADPRAYTDRLNEIVTAGGWTRQYTVHTISPVTRMKGDKPIQTGKVLVTCVVTITGIGSHSGSGEEWADDKNAMTRADTRAAQSAIHRAVSNDMSRTAYWLDIGNNASSGQYVLGQPWNARNRRKVDRLRTIGELYPEIIDTGIGEDPLPSCSAVEALERQLPFVNQTLAFNTLATLSQLFRYGRLRHHGGFFNAVSGTTTPLPVDPALWSKTRRRNGRRRAA